MSPATDRSPPREPLQAAACDLLVGIVGAGTMGSGIAEVAARAGHPVLLLDVTPGAAACAIAGIAERLERDRARGRLDADQVEATLTRLSPAGTVGDLAGCGLVLEAVAEDLPLKRDLVADLEAVLGADAVLATNTSSLSVTAVAAGLHDPSRLVGLHFFNPAPRMPLVEVVHGEDSDPAVVDAACALVQAWGKTPVRCTSTPGFVVNRVARPFYGEAQRLVEEGCAGPSVVDRVLRDAGGFPMGPLELTDLVGQDVNLAVSRSVWEQTFHDPRYAPTVYQQRLVDAGRLGRKTGRGVYRYDAGSTAPGGPRPEPVELPRTPAPAGGRWAGGWAVMSALQDRIIAAAIRSAGAEPADGAGLLLPSGGRLVETTGTAAVDLGAQVVVLDWALSPGSTTRVALAAAPGCSIATVAEAIGLVQSAGVEVELVQDVAGLVVARTVSMLVNEAVDLVARGGATAADLDTAMRSGTGYPLGPLEWGDRIGPRHVLEVLVNLQHAYPTGRYRPSPALRRAVATGTPLRG